MPIDDSDNSDAPAVIVPPPDCDVPNAIPAGSLPPAKTILDPIPPLREIRARVVNLGDEAAGGSSDAARGDRSAVLLEDPEGFATQPAALSTLAYALALLFDGKRSALDAAEAFKQKYGQTIQPEQALLLQDELEQAMFLSSSTFEETVQHRMNQYLDLTAWPMTHAGSAYPASADAFAETVEGFFSAPDGPGEMPDLAGGTPAARGSGDAEDKQGTEQGTAPWHPARAAVRALIAPHIDLRVGGATYAHAYRELMRAGDVDLIFILGVAHQNTGERLFCVSQKDFETPHGTLATHKGIAERLHEASGTDGIAAEMSHRGEHSIEFQAALIQALVGERGGRKVEIVPILCGAVESFLARDAKPFQDEEFLRFTGALRKELEGCGRKWCVLCSVDLSHVGPEFGHSSLMDERLLKPLERMDLKLLSFAERLAAEGFYDEIARTQNSRHVDAVLSVLAMLSACKGLLTTGRLLHYDQMMKAQSHSAVSYAALSFE